MMNMHWIIANPMVYAPMSIAAPRCVGNAKSFEPTSQAYSQHHTPSRVLAGSLSQLRTLAFHAASTAASSSSPSSAGVSFFRPIVRTRSHSLRLPLDTMRFHATMSHASSTLHSSRMSSVNMRSTAWISLDTAANALSTASCAAGGSFTTLGLTRVVQCGAGAAIAVAGGWGGLACATVGMPIAAAASPAATAHPRTPPHDPPSVAVLSPARIDLGGAGGRSSSAEAPARARILGPRTRELLTVMDIPPTIGAGLEGADARGPTRRIRAGAVDAMDEEAVHAIAAISRIYSAVLCTVERAASGARGLTSTNSDSHKT